jgi:hypothetical protein
MSGIGWIFLIFIWIIPIIGLWKVFEKADEAGWQAIIPIWNYIVILKIVGRPLWWIVLYLIPFVDIVIHAIVCNDLSKSFRRGAGTTVGLFFLPWLFYIILGFGDAEYQGPAAGPTAATV